MKSIKELYRIGTGPSSSHTMAPRRAAEQFLARHPEAAAFRVTLYGSLAATGRGHMTDRAIIDTLLPTAPVDIVWQAREFLPFHPNGMRFEALDTAGTPTDTWTVYSIGGGELAEEGVPPRQAEEIYEMNTLDEILAWCRRTGRTYWEYVEECESDDIWDYLAEIWQAMRESVERGLDHEGVLPGPLHLTRRAATYHVRASGYKQSLQSRGLVFAYALAVAEENASGGRIVTAPTCGSSGVVPAVLYHLQKSRGFSDARIYRALATAGLFGNVVKHNASISGAEVGCQGEVGVACAMAAAAANQLFGGSPSQIEYARGGPRARRPPRAGLHRRRTPRLVRPRGRGDETDGARPSLDLQGDGRGRTGTGVRSRQVTMRGGTLSRVPPRCLVRKNQSFPGKYFMYCTRWKNSESLLPKPSRPLNSSSAVMP